MLSRNQVIIKGDSIAFRYALTPAQSMDGWACTVQIHTKTGSSPQATVSVNTQSSDGNALVGLYSTGSLAPGEYVAVAKLTNAGTSESKEIQTPFVLAPSRFT